MGGESADWGLAESGAFEFGGEGVEADVAEEVAAEAGLDGVEATDGGFYPSEVEGVGEAFEFGADVDVANAVWCVALKEQDVFEDAGERAEECRGADLAFGAGAVRFGHAEERCVVAGLGVAEYGEGVETGGGVLGQVEAVGAADGAF